LRKISDDKLHMAQAQDIERWVKIWSGYRHSSMILAVVTALLPPVCASNEFCL